MTHDESLNSPRPDVIVARPIGAPSVSPARWGLPHISRRDAALDLVLILVAALVVPYGFQIAVVLLAPGASMGAPPASVFAITKWFDALLVVAIAFYLVRRHGIRPDAFGMQLDRFGRQLLWSLAGLGSVYVVMVPTVMIVFVFVTLFPSMQADVAQRQEFLEMLPIHDIAITVLLLVAVAIHEELLFRGLLIPYLRRIGLNWTGAVVVSTALFASLHGMQGALGVFQIFFVGSALAVVFILSRSLLAVMIAHFLFDFIQFQLVRVLLPVFEKLPLDELAPGGGG